MDPKHLELIEAYSYKFYWSLVREGFFPDRDEIQSELSFRYVKAGKSWNDCSNNTARFETYLVQAFNNALTDYRNALWRERKLFEPLAHGQDIVEDLNFLEELEENELLAGFSGIERTLAQEFISPSESVLAELARITEGRTKVAASPVKVLRRAVMNVYEINENTFYDAISRMKKKVFCDGLPS